MIDAPTLIAMSLSVCQESDGVAGIGVITPSMPTALR
jgi:hypothetical protein